MPAFHGFHTLVSGGKSGYRKYARPLATEINRLDAAGALRIRHRLHLRAETCSETLEDELAEFASSDRVGILSLMEAKTNDPVNIGNPHEVTIEEIAQTIVKLIGSRSKIVYRPLPVDDPKQRQPDITRARTLLGWEPRVGLEEGLAKAIEYFKAKTAQV